jgi:hypothetical protein
VTGRHARPPEPQTVTVKWDADLERFVIRVSFAELADLLASASTVHEVVDFLGVIGVPLADVEVIGDPQPERRHHSHEGAS